MACFASEEDKKNRLIDAELQQDRRKRGNSVDLLLFGKGCNTVAKQLRLLSLDGYQESERRSYTPVIANQIMKAIRVLIDHTKEFGYPLSDANQNLVSLLENPPPCKSISTEIGNAIASLWDDSAIQQTFSRSAEFELHASTKYFMVEIKRISDPAYVPTDQDVLRANDAHQNVIRETRFDYDGCHFNLVDVTQLHTATRKWLYCFEDVLAILYCVDLSSYDKFNMHGTNKMHLAIQEFKEICSYKWFTNMAFIMFYNRKDILEEKIKRVPLTVCFPQYQGEQTYEAAVQYISRRFEDGNNNPNRLLYNRFTCSTDSSNVTYMLNAVKDIVLGRAIAQKIQY